MQRSVMKKARMNSRSRCVVGGRLAFAVFMLVAVASMTASGVNLVQNPGFATQGSVFERAASWEDNVTGGVWGNSERSSWNNQDQDGYSHLVKGSWGGFSYGGCWQRMAVTAGNDYTLKAQFYYDNGWSAMNWKIRAEWFDGSGTKISEEELVISGVPSGAWTERSFTATAPAGAVNMNFVLDVSSIGTSGAMYMDAVDVQETVVPPPPTGWGIRNAGFEDQGSSDTQAAEWETGDGGKWGSAARRAWNKRSGDWSMALQASWSGFDYGGVWQALVVTSRTEYTVSAYMLRDQNWTATSLNMKLEWYDVNGTKIGEDVLDANDLAAWTWTEKTISTVAPSGATKMHFIVEAEGISASDCMYVDDISISAGAIIPEEALQLVVNTALDNKPISKYLYGLNIANWAAGYYLEQCTPAIKDGGFTVVRYGATNIERYNYKNNRLYNVISRLNQYVPVSWESFVDWCLDELDAEPLVQVPAFGHVASDGWGLGDPTYDHVQTMDELSDWIEEAGPYVKFWQIGNEPMIAWKRADFKGHYKDGAHGDQILNKHMDYDYYFPRFATIANTIKDANPSAKILGPTPANWWLYWSSDYSPYCPVTEPNGYAHSEPTDALYTNWLTMLDNDNNWDPSVFPCRGGQPEVVGWETDTNRFLCQFASRMSAYETQYGRRLADFMDVHRYMNCYSDRDAINETRGLIQDGYGSQDQETGFNPNPKLLHRFHNILNTHYPNTDLSFSEYDFFYWNGAPTDFQVAALGQMDYIGFFAEMGVQLACNWYLGEPDQSGGGFEHASDAAKQAMFQESGEPNPKYWILWMMSRYFRDTVVHSDSADWDQVSIHAAIRTNENEVVVFVSNKGAYDSEGHLEDDQPTRAIDITINGETVSSVKKILRYGKYDPYVVEMELSSATLSGNKVSCDIAPLAAYAIILSTDGTTDGPSDYLHVNPASLDFGPYVNGEEEVEDHGHTKHVYTHVIKVSNARANGTSYTVTENCPWLTIDEHASGTADVTTEVPFIIDRTGLGYGRYETTVTVATAEGTVLVPVAMDVIPGAAQGEKRICDFDTGSLAHTWGAAEPFSIGWWDSHGNPEDRNSPYIYTLSLDNEEKSSLGSIASMKVEYDRSNGDLANGRLYSAFGTYGHEALIHDHDTGNVITNKGCADWQGYDSLQIDIKADTYGAGQDVSEFLLVIKDKAGNAGKPALGIAHYKDRASIQDGKWMTLNIPLNGTFYDWNAQDGSTTTLDLANIAQLEIVPWAADESKAGVIWLDNVRVVKANASGNEYPVAVASQNKTYVEVGDTVALAGNASYDPDGTLSSYSWKPATGLSDASVASPNFMATAPGTYTYELTVTDNQGEASRNPAQVVITVLPELDGGSITLYRDEAMTDTLVGDDSLDVYVKYTCTSGGSASEADFTFLTVGSSSTYTGDPNNNCDDIQVLIQETGADTKEYVGSFKLRAFSDSAKAEIGANQGDTITVSDSDANSASFVMGEQRYGLLRWVDRFEFGIWSENHFRGYACAYNDNMYDNTSDAWVNYDDTDYAPCTTAGVDGGSQASLKADVVLHLGPQQDYYRLFGGIACKMNPFSDGFTNDVLNLDMRPQTTWTKGVTFWLKGNGKQLSVVLKSSNIDDYDDYVYTIDHTPSAWRRFVIPIDEFHQEGWGTTVSFDDALCSVEAIQFKASSKTDGEYSQFFVDDLGIIGGVYEIVTNVHNSGHATDISMELLPAPVIAGIYGYKHPLMCTWSEWGDIYYTRTAFLPGGAVDATDGNNGFHIGSTNAVGFWLGSILPVTPVANMMGGGYHSRFGEPSQTNWSVAEGVAATFKYLPSSPATTTYPASDGSPMRVRFIVSNDTTPYEFADAGMTRWYTVDSQNWSDLVMFKKSDFYTWDTVDLAVTNATVPWVEWQGDWSNIQKFRVDFGGTSDTAEPDRISMDSLWLINDKSDEYLCPWQ